MPRTARKSLLEKNSIPAKSIRPKRKESKTIADSSSSTILSLPNELLHSIISNLTSQERAPLGFVCKRFRHADLEVPREFETLVMRWEEDKQSITTSSINGTSIHEIIRGSNDKPIQATPHFLRMFKRAKSKVLGILYEKDVADPEADFEVIASLCESIAFDKMRVRWYNSAESADKFIPALFANRDSTNAQLAFTFYFKNAQELPNIPASRQLLMKLPKLKNFRLHWIGWGRLASPILNDATLLHIVSNTDHAVLDTSDFTAQGLLEVFEVVCKSDLPQKFVQISSEPDKKGVRDLERRFQFDYRGVWTKYRHVDRKHQTVLTISGGAYHTVCFQMHKIDQNECATFDIVQW